ncbi:MAG: hypothetical protein V8Q83_09525 [Blautia sp.]
MKPSGNARNVSIIRTVKNSISVGIRLVIPYAGNAAPSAAPCIVLGFTPRLCDRLKKPPYVCNDCPQIRSCSHDFYFYRANYANDIYSETKSSSRSGINQTPESLEQLDRLVSPLLLQGQPLSHIFVSNEDSVSCSIRTLYNYIDQGYFTAINLDLPRKVRYKKRRKARREPDNTGDRKGRSYQDFERYLEKFPDTNVVELDVVEGAGGKSKKSTLDHAFP